MEAITASRAVLAETGADEHGRYDEAQSIGRGRLRYVATPIYDAPGCDGPSYRSVLLVPRESTALKLGDLRGAVVAINEPSSNSGCNLLAAAVAPLADGAPFFGSAIARGSHLASIRAVADQRAGIAAIDVVTYAHLGRARPALIRQVRPIGWTAPAPRLPFVTSTRSPPALVSALREALTWAYVAPELAGARSALLLNGVVRFPETAYASLTTLSDADGRTIPRSLAGNADGRAIGMLADVGASAASPDTYSGRRHR